MQVQRRMTEIREAGKAVYSTLGAGTLSAAGVTLRPGAAGEVSEEIARAFQHKLVKPGSQVAGESVKPIAECALDFDAPQVSKPKASTKSKGPSDGEGSSAT